MIQDLLKRAFVHDDFIDSMCWMSEHTPLEAEQISIAARDLVSSGVADTWQVAVCLIHLLAEMAEINLAVEAM